MKRVKCQRATFKDCRKNGCPTCHGYGDVLVLFKCNTCSRTGFARPGVLTIYEGKRFTTFDGIEGSYGSKGWQCKTCKPFA